MQRAASFPINPGNSIRIGNSRFAFGIRKEIVTYYLDLEPIARHRKDDSRALKLVIGRLVVLNNVSRTDLAKALGVSRSTVQRAARCYRKHGEGAYLLLPVSRGRLGFSR